MLFEKLFKGNDYSTTCGEPYLYAGLVTNDFATLYGCRLVAFIGDMGTVTYRPLSDDIERLIKPMFDIWCNNCFSGSWLFENDYILIEEHSDAMLFKLTWC